MSVVPDKLDMQLNEELIQTEFLTLQSMLMLLAIADGSVW